jgi:TPR repeat protein
MALLSRAAPRDYQAAEELAGRHRTGFATPKDLLKAVRTLYQAASRRVEFDLQQYRLSVNDPDATAFNELLDLFAKGVHESDRASIITLARMHAEGANGEVNLPRAAALYDRAAAVGDRAAAAMSGALQEKFDAQEKARYLSEKNWIEPRR